MNLGKLNWSLSCAASLVLGWSTAASATESRMVGFCEHSGTESMAAIFAVYGSEGLAQLTVSLRTDGVWNAYSVKYVMPWFADEPLTGTLTRIEGALRGDGVAAGSDFLNLNAEGANGSDYLNLDLGVDGDDFDIVTLPNQMHFLDCRAVANGE